MDEMLFFTGDKMVEPLAELKENPSNAEILDFMMQLLASGLNQCKLAYKGGYMLTQIMKDKSRLTHDIDFSIDAKEQYELVKDVLKVIGETLVQKGVAEDYRIKSDLTETSSGGIKIRIAGGPDVGIDVGLHSLKFGITQYHLDVGKVDGFRVERMLGDKIQALFTPKRFRRTKDMYDIYCLINSFDVEFSLLKTCLESRGPIDWDKSPNRIDIIEQYAHAWDKLVLQNPITEVQMAKPELKVVLELFDIFVSPLRDSVKYTHTTWKCAERRWS